MKYEIFFILILFSLVLSSAACCSGQPDTNIMIPDSAWTWNPGAINQFSGEYDLSEFRDITLSIRITSDLPQEEDTETDNAVVFTTINGKRIPVLKQGSNVQFTPDADNPLFRFTGQIKLPKKHRVNKVNFQLLFYDGDGNEIGKTAVSAVSRETTGDISDGSFYISLDIQGITMILSAAAAVIWICALCRSRINRKKNRNGEMNYADL